MTISSQTLSAGDRAAFKKILKEATPKQRIALDKKLAKIVREAIEESGSAAVNSKIAAKIKERILS
jgi:TRAP-type C4-dicarboxylate transport system substrate-binding protein